MHPSIPEKAKIFFLENWTRDEDTTYSHAYIRIVGRRNSDQTKLCNISQLAGFLLDMMHCGVLRTILYLAMSP